LLAWALSILIACHSKARKVYSIDVNLVAVKLMQENARLNRVESIVVPILDDAKDAVTKHLQNVADRIAMPLPEKTFAYLDYAVTALKASSGSIHYWDFEHASKNDEPVEKIKAKVDQKLLKLGVSFTVSLGELSDQLARTGID